MLEIDSSALAKSKIDRDSLLRALRAEFLSVKGVARADRISELALVDTVHDKIARRWLSRLFEYAIHCESGDHAAPKWRPGSS